MGEAVISLGSNLGDRVFYLNKAINKIDHKLGEIIIKSSIYESEAWGFITENSFLNQIIIIKTNEEPDELLIQLLKIENDLGRVRKTNKYESRPIDLDILFYDDLILSDDHLQLPHPRVQERRFVLEPLQQIIPDFIHPILQKSIKQLYKECTDKLWVKKYIF